MKKIFKYVPIILGLVMVMSSCGDDDEDQLSLAPTLSVSVNGSQVASGATVNALTGDTITFAITANKVGTGKDLNTMTITQSGSNQVSPFNITAGANDPYNFADGSAQSLKNADDETFIGTGIFTNITGTVGSTTYTITVTDNDELSTSVSVTIAVSAPVTSTPFTMTKTGKIWHINSQARGSWSLSADTTISSANNMNEMNADIINTTLVGTPMDGAFKVGSSRSNTNFVIADASFDYDAATVTSATAAYNAGTVDADKADVAAVGDVYLFMVSSNIIAVKITEVNTTDASQTNGTSTGFMSFEYKK